ncbi:MAG: hypothetical protein LAO19_21455 [Acidobacteriia bacterium]|nr:hypothetical protein [Terriglobia bacterium]
MGTQENTIAELKAKLKDAWLRGREQRIEIGTLLLELREHAAHGTWGKLLAEIGIPASTAVDYMIEASRQIHGIRIFGKAPAPKPIDVEGQEIEQAVNLAMAEVEAVGNGNATSPATVLGKGEDPSGNPPPPITGVQAKPKRVEPQLELNNRVKGPVLFCTAAQKEQYEAAKKKDRERVYRLFYNALMEAIAETEASDEALAA